MTSLLISKCELNRPSEISRWDPSFSNLSSNILVFMECSWTGFHHLSNILWTFTWRIQIHVRFFLLNWNTILLIFAWMWIYSQIIASNDYFGELNISQIIFHSWIKQWMKRNTEWVHVSFGWNQHRVNEWMNGKK